MIMNTNTGFILRGDNHSQKFVMQANLRFVDLCKYAEFTYMSDPTLDPYRIEGRKSYIESKSGEGFYQREVDKRRVGEIVAYIKKMILSTASVDNMSLFPTALLLAAHWEEEDGNKLQVGCDCRLDNFYQNVNSLYIVDGQHRLSSLKRLYAEVYEKYDSESLQIKSYLEAYVFNCMVLLNYDLWEQAKVFADVNFNQKSVNKSLYYSIFGMPENQDVQDLKKSNIFIAHQLTKYMNSEPHSPLYHCIKMLGTGQGYISQAFFADSLIKNFQPRGIWEMNSDADRKNYRYMAIELCDFFEVVKKVFADMWPSEDGVHKSILTKTTGIGVLIWIMAYIHKVILPNDLITAMPNDYTEKDRAQYKDIIRLQMMKVYPYREKLFAIGGMYGSTGGKGQEASLRKEMQRIIDED